MVEVRVERQHYPGWLERLDARPPILFKLARLIVEQRAESSGQSAWNDPLAWLGPKHRLLAKLWIDSGSLGAFDDKWPATGTKMGSGRSLIEVWSGGQAGACLTRIQGAGFAGDAKDDDRSGIKSRPALGSGSFSSSFS